jgi:LmbE family N-acetylglucosaminyl deacetylase
VDLTTGEPTPCGSEAKRGKEAAGADRILGINARENLGLENRYLSDTKQARLLLAEKIRVFKPDALLCPADGDAHPDHQAATGISEGARFYAKYSKTTLKGTPHYPCRIFYYSCIHIRSLPKISFLVDISAQFKKKMRAIRCYRSQFIDNPRNAEVFDYVEAQNRYLGKLIRCEYAEAIYCKEAAKVNDLAVLL